jgi:FMN phosphatase YigB (HAD superfamily)
VKKEAVEMKPTVLRPGEYFQSSNKTTNTLEDTMKRVKIFSVLILVSLSWILRVSPTYSSEIYGPGAHEPLCRFDRDHADRNFTAPGARFPNRGEITTVIFDVGGVLADDLLKPLRILLADRFSEDFGLTENDLKTASEKVTRLNADLGYEFDSGYHRRLLKQALRSTELGAQLGDSEIDQLIDTRIDWTSWESTLRDVIREQSLCNEPVVRLAQELKEAGYTVAVLSDDSIEMARARMDVCGYLDIMGRENIFISSTFHTKKPGAEIYRIVLEKLGLADSPERAVFIDNKTYNIHGDPNQPSDGSGATGVGIWGILFEGQKPGPDGYVKGESVANLRHCLEVIGVELQGD